MIVRCDLCYAVNAMKKAVSVSIGIHVLSIYLFIMRYMFLDVIDASIPYFDMPIDRNFLDFMVSLGGFVGGNS